MKVLFCQLLIQIITIIKQRNG